jgi:hypothetical protein
MGCLNGRTGEGKRVTPPSLINDGVVGFDSRRRPTDGAATIRKSPKRASIHGVAGWSNKLPPACHFRTSHGAYIGWLTAPALGQDLSE